MSIKGYKEPQIPDKEHMCSMCKYYSAGYQTINGHLTINFCLKYNQTVHPQGTCPKWEKI